MYLGKKLFKFNQKPNSGIKITISYGIMKIIIQILPI